MMVVQKMFGGVDSFHLMAVPLFMFTGVIMEEGGISRRIIDLANALVGWLPGGMAAVTIVSAMFFRRDIRVRRRRCRGSWGPF